MAPHLVPSPATEPLRPLALVGPTASGKSAVSLLLAQHYPLEIISVDSALVYRGMDIGTAKPTPAELAQVPHHLIDIRDPAQAYSAAEFATDAQRLMADIQGRGKHPLLVGGTMLYLRALLHPLDDLPPAQPELRAALEAEAAALGWPALHAQLAEVDPTTAARLSPNDGQRVGRALEVWRATGQPLSGFHTGGAARSLDPHLHPHRHPHLHMPVISLEPADRAWLHARIAQRFDDMLAQGLVDEVRRLMATPGLHPDLPSMRCVGYRQVWEALQTPGAQNASNPQEGENKKEHTSLTNKATEAHLIQKIKNTGVAATRQLAKRQLTWLRGMAEREVEAADAPLLAERVLARVRQHWG
jgi:tRNA dimethylallyltransferase